MQIVFKSCTHIQVVRYCVSHVKHLVSIGLLVCFAFFYENLDAKQEFANVFFACFLPNQGVIASFFRAHIKYRARITTHKLHTGILKSCHYKSRH